MCRETGMSAAAASAGARTSRRATKTTRRTRRTPRTASSVAAPAEVFTLHGALPGRRSPQVRQLPAQKPCRPTLGSRPQAAVRPEASGDRAKASAKDDYERRVKEDYVLSHTREPEHWIKGEGGGKVLNPAWKLWERRRRKGRRVDGFGDSSLHQ